MKKLVSPFILVLLAATLLLSACGVGAKSVDFVEERDMYDEPTISMPAEAPAAESAADGGYSGGTVGNAVSPQSAERLVIKNASLSIVVDDPQRSMNALSAMAEGMGGFVVSSYLYQTTLASGIEVPSASITIRVPAEGLQDALEQIEAGAKQVLSRNESGQDVTAEYTDLQSRLRNLQDAEELLRQIMQEATDTEDILAAFNQLNSITEQIEILKGQIQYYEESAAMSAISVELIASQAVQPITIGGWEPVGVAKEAVQALVNALQGLADLLIWLALYILPIALIIGLPLWLLVRGLRRWSAKRKAGPKRRK
jgi:hypothetical protein